MCVHNDNQDVYPPPTRCTRCGNQFLEVSIFGRGKEWEVNCIFCGHLWWPRRRKLPRAFQKYRYAKDNDTTTSDPPARIPPDTEKP